MRHKSLRQGLESLTIKARKKLEACKRDRINNSRFSSGVTLETPPSSEGFSMHYDTTVGLAPITCSVKAAVAATGLGKDTIYKMLDDRRLESATVGGRRLVFVDSLQTYLEACRVNREDAA